MLLVGATSCSSAAPQQMREDPVASGEETAKTAADAARQAEEEGNTGILIESSREAAPPEDDEEEAPSPERSVLEIELRSGTPTMDGEPIPEGKLEDVIREAVEANPDLLVVFVRDSKTGPEMTTKYIEQARSAGAKSVEERPALP
jgi:hypothetical protein